MTVLLLAFGIGAVAGLRTLVPPTAIAWAAYLGWLDYSKSPLFFLAHPASLLVFSGLLVLELVADKLPATPARTVPVQFASRLASGAFAGAALGLAGSSTALLGGLAGLAGACLGTLSGRRARLHLAHRLGRDRAAALLEDAVAVAAAILLVALAAR